MGTDSKRPDLVAVREGDEGRDVDIRFKVVIWIGVAVAIITLAGYGITTLYVDNLLARPYAADRPAAPMAAANRRVVPPGPRLQTHPEADLAAMLEQQTQLLESFGWIDQDQGKVRIPIDRAMDLFLTSKGLVPVEETIDSEQEGAQ